MSYDNPNFTIITTGGCNSFCDFCTDAFKRKPSPEYLKNLIDALSHRIPAHFTQVSISGGEPTLSPLLSTVLELIQMSKRFRKVVLTTNGARLTENVELFKKTINHLNVSRHAIGYDANTKIFGTKDIVSDLSLKAAAFELNKAGIDVNLNHVYKKDSALTMDYVFRYIEYARSVGATSVSFRYDQNQNTLEPTYLEKLFSDWVAVNQGGCPVCRNHTVLVNGFPVVFKASFAEPSKAIDDVYELVYHITGKLTTDWEGQREFTPEMAKTYTQDFTANPHKQHAVVAHSVAVPNNPARGQKQAETSHVTVPAAAPAKSFQIQPSVLAGLINTRGANGGNRSGSNVGGGCGGGGCGSSASSPAPTPTRAKDAYAGVGDDRGTPRTAELVHETVGGGCGGGLGFGGGCGS